MHIPFQGSILRSIEHLTYVSYIGFSLPHRDYQAICMHAASKKFSKSFTKGIKVNASVTEKSQLSLLESKFVKNVTKVLFYNGSGY